MVNNKTELNHSVVIFKVFRTYVNIAVFNKKVAQTFNAGTPETILQQSVTKFAAFIKNKLLTQHCHRKNYWSLYSTARIINTTARSTRAHDMRMRHPSLQGFVDPVQSPDEGPKVGLHKQLSVSAFPQTGNKSPLKN